MNRYSIGAIAKRALKKERNAKNREAEKSKDSETGAFNPPDASENLEKRISVAGQIVDISRLRINDYLSIIINDLEKNPPVTR